jgi:GNAT superfamily N-acetyltransferase
MTISLRPATPADAAAISQLILGLTSYIEARPVDPGCESFLDTLTPEAIAERIAAPGFVYIVAEDESGICGVAALRDARHVYHLFVKQELHRQGLARALLERIMRTSNSSFFTVNSSLFAVPVYLRFGFVRAGEQQTRNGVTVQPMVYTKADQTSGQENSA